MITKESKNIQRQRRHVRVRKKVSVTTARPRLSVRRSLKHIYAQIINDEQGHTLVAASSLDKDLKTQLEGLSMKEIASKVGELLGQRAKDQGIEALVFDRGGYKYHGKVAALADGVRSAGLNV
jgi:large subunit ribosomal protein L18